MKLTENEKGLLVETEDVLDLKNTFDCGQCFRWDEDGNGRWSGIVRGRYAAISPAGGGFFIEGADRQSFEEIWKDYLDLDNDYREIKKELAVSSELLIPALESMDGIRILRQEPWEALCSFIISQNNNIPRIKGIISRLCEGFGADTGRGYSFPSADALASLSVEELAPLRAGFRARYILDAARKVSAGVIRLEDMYEMPIDDCRRELMKITGVGVKVAECTLLYGFHRLEAFPVDVWMKKALEADFSGLTPEKLGRYAGVAQQYIFHYTRLTAQS